MADEKYYDILHSITSDHTVNHKGCLVGGVLPFLSDAEAARFVVKKFPEAPPDANPITWEPEKAREIAAKTMYELEYLLQMIYDKVDYYRKKRIEYIKMADQSELERKPWETDTYKERAKEFSWVASGMEDAADILRDRVTDLLNMCPPPPREWWAARNYDEN